jgi:hypothetical protein
MLNLTYGSHENLTAVELTAFYRRLNHPIHAQPEAINRMMTNSTAFVTVRNDQGELVGVARGVSDGLRGYLTECKLDPEMQGPAAITRKDGRIEDDQYGIAAELARRVLAKMFEEGVQRVDTLAWGTEVDFAEELGFKRLGGLVALTLVPDESVAVPQTVAAKAHR